jgi:transposase
VPRERRLFSREFKLAALARFETSGNAQALARELGIRRELLYKWREKYAAEGAPGLNATGRPRPIEMPPVESGGEAEDEVGRARRRIAELERKVGQQELELDFFRSALRQVKGPGRGSGGPGGPASTR